jgi:glyoxylase-like metal-dependent hydrolase (beta-lactamase superfamily II)
MPSVRERYRTLSGSSNRIRTRGDIVAAMATEVAPGIHRLGNEIVNFYLVEDGEGLAIFDAGLPLFRAQLEALLRARRRTLGDVDAVVLTHGHLDHVGIAETVRQAGAAVHVHESDAAMARDGVEQKTERGIVPYLRYGATWKLLGLAVRSGGMRRPKIAELTTFGDGAVLDVPGRPQVVHTPGHSHGHVAFHFPDRGALIAGDAVCTWNPLTGRTGPQLMSGAFSVSSAQAMESLGRIEPLDAGVVLPGHGDPWTDGTAALVARAREAGPS